MRRLKDIYIYIQSRVATCHCPAAPPYIQPLHSSMELPLQLVAFHPQGPHAAARPVYSLPYYGLVPPPQLTLPCLLAAHQNQDGWVWAGEQAGGGCQWERNPSLLLFGLGCGTVQCPASIAAVFGPCLPAHPLGCVHACP